MKKSLFLIPCLAAALWSCSDKDVVGPENGGNQNGSEKVGYLTINVATVDNAGTRDGNDHPYKDGLAAEYDVKDVRFFFFNQDKNVVRVVNGSSYFFDHTNPTITDDLNDDNISRTINATVVLTTAPNNTSAYYIAAVVNPTSELKTATANINNYADLLGKLMSEYNYTTQVESVNKTYFLMSSSVTKGSQAGEIADLVDIHDKIFDSEGDATTGTGALGNPATVYVERVAAKVSVNVDITDKGTAENVYKLSSVGNYTGGDLYVQLNGWNVTATANKAYAIKNLNPSWLTTDPFSGWLTSATEYDHRSYWALNPTPSSENEFGWTYFPYNDTNWLTDWEEGANKVNYTYLHENAYDSTVSGSKLEPVDDTTEDSEYTENGFSTIPTTSKILVKATLCQANGTAVPLVEFLGKVYAYDENEFLGWMSSISGFYKKTTSGNNEVYTSVNDELADLLTPVEYQSLDDDMVAVVETIEKLKGVYYLTFAQLDETETATDAAVEALNLYVLIDNDGQVSYQKITTIADFNTQMIKLAGGHKIWKDGQTYYFLNIKHLNTGNDVAQTALGYYGVVRNHWYEYNITGISGLGTPVFDPSTDIFPQTPSDDPWSYIAAEVKILSWHKISQDDVVLGGSGN